jgi:hypothetical protein
VSHPAPGPGVDVGPAHVLRRPPALDGIDLRVPEGGVFALLGSGGAGRATGPPLRRRDRRRRRPGRGLVHRDRRRRVGVASLPVPPGAGPSLTCRQVIRGNTLTTPNDRYGVDVTETRELDEMISEALAVIDKGLGDLLHRELVSSNEVADLLLDVRTLLASPGSSDETRDDVAVPG